jgi:glucan-binding YG repeat protein
MEIDGSNLKNGEKYVYNLDNVTNNLILASSIGLNNTKDDVIQIEPKSGNQYIIADTKMEALKNNEWSKINNEWIYVKNGQAVTGWYKSLANEWYYMNNKGIMQKGWVNYNGMWYYLSNNGAMDTGWIKDNGKWYHLSNNGSMDTGWIKDTNGKWYYLNANGLMASNTRINGYKLDKNGDWIK